MTARYALYLAPAPGTPLARFGAAVLGTDAETGGDVPQLVPEGFDAHTFHALTEDPRRYGFHATLKAPFRLAEGVEEAELVSGLNAFAARRPAFALPSLAVTSIGRAGEGGFVALAETAPTPALLALERAAVEGFERFRAPLNEVEVARRRPERLTERQRLHLEGYGYPYVFEDFRFHLTLTGRVPARDVDRMRAALASLYAAEVPPAPVPVEDIALFHQPGPGERFRVRARARLLTTA